MTLGLGVLKGVLKIVSEASVAQVVKNMVVTSTPWNLSGYKKGLTKVGGFVLSGIAADLAGKQIDSIFDMILNPKKKEPEEKKHTLIGMLVRITLGGPQKGKHGEIVDEFEPGKYDVEAMFVVKLVNSNGSAGLFKRNEIDLMP